MIWKGKYLKDNWRKSAEMVWIYEIDGNGRLKSTTILYYTGEEELEN